MLSAEGNENGPKTTTGLIRNFARAAHFFCTFLCRCFARLQRKTPRNVLVTRFVEEMSQVFLLPLFSLPLTFTLVAASISHFLTAATKVSCCFSNNFSFFSLSLSLQLSVAPILVELRWPVANFLFFSAFLFLYIPYTWTRQSIQA